MTTIAKYITSVSFTVDKRSLSAVDRTLNRLENRLKNFGKLTNKHLKITFDIGKFNVDQRRLDRALGDALDLSSLRNVFQISRFDIDQQHLNRSVATAAQIAARHANMNIRPNVQPGRMAEGRGITPRHAIAAGGIGGIAARAYMPVLALAGGGYGLNWLNQRNQQVVAAQLQTQAVVQQAGGTAAQGMQSFDWLRAQGNRVGFNYLEAAPDFSRLVGGLTGAGMSVEESQDVFKGFAELSRVNKATPMQQKRLFKALSDVAGKGKLQAEELTQQFAEALPGSTALFAQAYQEQIGGKLTGKEAIAQLMADMKKGKVKSDILIPAAQLASKRAEKGLAAASTASQAEQARAQNALTDQAIIASNAGIEEGFARLFKTFAVVLNESTPLVEKMAQGFNTMSMYASNVLLSVQSITRFFEGRDSLLGDKLFGDEESRQKAFEFVESFKNAMSEMDTLGGNIYASWEKIFSLFDVSTGLEKATNFLNLVSNTAGILNSLSAGEYQQASMSAQGAGGSGFKAMLGINPISSTLDLVTGGKFSNLVTRPFNNLENPAEFETTYKAEQARMAANAKNQYALPGVNQPLNGMQSTNLEIKMDVKIDAANPEDFNDKFQQQFKSVLESTLIQYSLKE